MIRPLRTSSAPVASAAACAPAFALATALALLVPPQVALAAQDSAPAGSPSAAASPPYWATVNGDNVLLRSSASSQNTYPFGRLFTGQPVKVIETEYGWSKVQAVGPTFANLYGFVKASDAVQYDRAAKKATVVGKASLTAPNMDAKFAPDKSWREIIVLAEGDTLEVIEEVQAQSDTYYSVRLPSKAFGWVHSQFISPVSQQEADTLEAALLQSSPAPAGAQQPASPPTRGADAGAAPANTDAVRPVAPESPQAGTPDSSAAGGTATPPAIVNNVPGAAPQETAEQAAERARAAAAEEAARAARMERAVRQATYADLEATWAVVRAQRAEEAELDALRQRYLALAEDEVAPAGTRDLSRARAEQLALRIEAQQAILELANQRAAMASRTQSIADLELALLKRRSFDGVGRLSASTVYDGTRLPLLYKLADPATGHTIAYVLPGPTTTPSEALGLVVGLKGKKRYDETLRVDVYEPTLIEVLDTSKTAVIQQP